MNDLSKFKTQPKTGEEAFQLNEKELPFSILDFWRWSQSDLLNNTNRGILAEFLVAKAIGLVNLGVRVEWDSYDIKTDKGLKIEVKSSAYLQSWEQQKLSSISFGIACTKKWDAETNIYSDTQKRLSDIYIFCILHHQDKTSVNALDLSQWTFYILETVILDEKRKTAKTINLNSLLSLQPMQCSFNEIKPIIKNLEQKILNNGK